jgi:predicted ATP-dependent endonuclease of OLD family
MKIKKLKIKNYKNLDADLVHNSDLIAFIGNNGSGKSNLLEAISHIFRSLYVSKYKVNFDYFIEYLTSKNNTVQIEKTGKELKYNLDGNNKSAIEISSYLPQKVIGIYSGEETRLFDDCYGPFYLEFVTNINKAQNQGTVYSELPKMLFLNKFYWNISLLCLLISDSQDNKRFVEQVLKIKDLQNIKIKIDFIKRNYSNYNDNQALTLVRDIDAKSEYTLDDFTKLLNGKYYTPYNVFKYLYLAYTPKDAKIIDDIIIEFSDGLTVSDLSEGEKKLLLIKGALEFAGQEDSIFILDEPDSHIHINNKEQIINSFKDYLHNRQIIITTHSPVLTQCVNDENVYMLNSGKIEDRNRQEIIQEVAGEFWNKHQQNSFLSSKKPIHLFVEGIHDKKHISNAYRILEAEYKDLQFDIFSLGGEGKIHPFLNGLYEANLKDDKLHIAIYDNDNAGDQAYTKSGYLPLQPPTEFRKLKEDKIKHNNFFAFKLPKPDNHNAECTIENMFDSTMYEQAYKEAFEGRIGKFEGFSIDKINEEILKDSKNILSNKTENLTNKEDFKNFRKLFDLIKEIKKYSDDNKVVVTVVKPTTTTPTTTKPVVKTPIPKISAKENHLKYWTAFKAFVATQKVSFKLQSPAPQHWTYVSIGSSDFKITLLANTQKNWICVQLLCRGKDALNDFKKLKAKYEKDASDNLSPDLQWKENKGKQEHHINLVFADNNPFDTTEWNNQHQLLSDWTEKFYNYFKDKLKEI